MSGLWVIGDRTKGKQAPQGQSRVELVACRPAKARRPGISVFSVLYSTCHRPGKPKFSNEKLKTQTPGVFRPPPSPLFFVTYIFNSTEKRISVVHYMIGVYCGDEILSIGFGPFVQ